MMAVLMQNPAKTGLTHVSTTEANELKKLGWTECTDHPGITKKAAQVAVEPEPATIETQPPRRVGRPRRPE